MPPHSIDGSGPDTETESIHQRGQGNRCYQGRDLCRDHNFGKFSKNDPIVKCSFKFKNTGTAPLVIHQAFASCGCTVPTFTKEPIKPGESGVIDVTYNGTDKFPGHFQKTVTVRSNAVSEVTRLIIEGDMQ